MFPTEVVLTTHPEDPAVEAIAVLAVPESVLCERCEGPDPEHSLTGEEITEGECRKCGRAF